MLDRRADGFHVLDSLIAFAELHDAIAVQAADAIVLRTEGPFAAALGEAEENLVLRAARALAGGAGAVPGAEITLTKNLPVASGIGGGSADAAAALKALNAFWQLGRSDRELAALGATLGADVPVCLFARTAYIGGIGETVEPGPALPAVGVVLVNPGVAVSTAAVFGARSDDYSEAARLDGAPGDARALAVALEARRNDLTRAACGLAPEIGNVLITLVAQPGCLLSRLTGTGATCFGLFPDADAAHDAAQRIAAAHDGWWVRATRFLE